MIIICPLCNGSGTWLGDPCWLCGGDGEIDLTDEAVLHISRETRILAEYAIRNTLLTEIADIKDKCNDIFEKLNE